MAINDGKLGAVQKGRETYHRLGTGFRLKGLLGDAKLVLVSDLVGRQDRCHEPTQKTNARKPG